MAVTITGAGGWATKIGHIIGRLIDLDNVRGSAIAGPTYSTPLTTGWATMIGDYTSANDYAIIQGATSPQGVTTSQSAQSALTAWQQTQQQILTYLTTLAQAITINMVNVDSAQPDRTLKTALATLIAQLQGNYHFTASSPSAGTQTNGTPTPNGAYSATGNSGPVIVTSFKDGKGTNLDNVLAETLKFLVTADSQSGGAVKWQEPLLITGQQAVSDVNSYLWPAGSGVSKTVNCVNAAGNNTGGNLLVNGEFATFTTANVPDNWAIATGTAGVQVLSSATGYLDSSCLEMVGDSATLTSVTQSFNTPSSTTVGAGGTPANLLTQPDVPFAVNFWLKCSSVPAAGKIQVDLVNGSGTIINDDASVANSKAIDLTSGGLNNTVWNNVNAVFRMPAVDPTAPVKLRIWQPTGNAVSTGTNVFIDRVAFAPMVQLYGSGLNSGVGGGPWVQAFSGNLQALLNDYWTLALANTWGHFLQGLFRLLRPDLVGLRFQTAGGSALDDTVGGTYIV